MLTYLFTASILLLVFALGYYLFLRQAPELAQRRRVLLLGIAGVLLLPLCPAPPIPHFVSGQVPVTQIVKTWEMETLHAASPFIGVADVPSDNSTVRMAVSRTLSPKGFLILGYRLIVLLFLGRLMIGVVRLTRIHRRSRASGEPNVRIIQGRGEAFTFGRMVYVSESVYHSTDFDVILAHERAHAMQLHTLDALVIEVFRAVFWFHPMAWWMREQVQLNLEYLADAAVLRAGYDRRAYQLSLVAHQQGTDFRTSLLPQFAAKGLKRRIKMMGFQAGPQVRSLVAIGGLILACFVTFTYMTGQATAVQNSNAQPGIAPLFDGDATELNVYFKRLPTPEEVAKIRPYLRDYFKTDLMVFQPCSEPDGNYQLFLGANNNLSAGSTIWSIDHHSDEPIRFQLTKDGSGSTGGATFRPMPPPVGAPNDDVLLNINGDWIAASVPGSKPYTTATLDRPLLAAAMECRLGITPENKEEYNIWRASLRVKIAGVSLNNKAADSALSNANLQDLPRTYYIGDRAVDEQTFANHESETTDMLYVAARTNGRADQVVLMMLE